MTDAPDPSEFSVRELRDEVRDIDDPEALAVMRAAEKAGKQRSTAIEAIEDRHEAVVDDSDNTQADDADNESASDGDSGTVVVRNPYKSNREYDGVGTLGPGETTDARVTAVREYIEAGEIQVVTSR